MFLDRGFLRRMWAKRRSNLPEGVTVVRKKKKVPAYIYARIYTYTSDHEQVRSRFVFADAR